MSRCHVRCRKCAARRVLKAHPETFYKYSAKLGEFVNRSPKCGNCGGNEYRVDGWMNRRDTRAMACTCKGYAHMTRDPDTTVWEMHRKGSPYCWYRKDGTSRLPGDADFKDYQLEQQPLAE